MNPMCIKIFDSSDAVATRDEPVRPGAKVPGNIVILNLTLLEYEMTEKSLGRARVNDMPVSLNNTERLGYPDNYPLNGSDERSDSLKALTVGRWHKSMFEVHDDGEHIEVRRKPEMEVTAADVRDAALRDPHAGLKMLNRRLKAIRNGSPKE